MSPTAANLPCAAPAARLAQRIDRPRRPRSSRPSAPDVIGHAAAVIAALVTYGLFLASPGPPHRWSSSWP